MASELKTTTVDKVHNDILHGVPESYQKTQGFPTWDLLRGVAFGLKSLWDKIFHVEYKYDVDNLVGGELELFIQQRTGLNRKAPVKATGIINVIKGDAFIIKGDTFETKTGIVFVSLEDKHVSDGGTIKVEALVGGFDGNVSADTVTEIPKTIQGLAQITNTNPMTGGYREETDEEYRERYYEYLRLPSSSGNVAHYKKWAKEVDGVKAVRVIPVWEGKNTVKVILVGNDYHPADATLVKSVSDYIDPNSTGEGLGVAPIGARCTVVSANAVKINITCTLLLDESTDVETVTQKIKDGVNEYLYSAVFNDTYISYAKIGSCIMAVDGVKDSTGLLVNGGTEAVTLDFPDCPVLGEVIVNV